MSPFFVLGSAAGFWMAFRGLRLPLALAGTALLGIGASFIFSMGFYGILTGLFLLVAAAMPARRAGGGHGTL